MAYTPVEIIALIIIIFTAIKLVVIVINPGSWMNFSKKLWSNRPVSMVISLILAAIVFYYLIREISIVQIIATMVFFTLLLSISLGDHVKEMIKYYEKKVKTKTLWTGGKWLSSLIWLALLVWGAIELFA